ncbi:MAG TPA: flagellar basal body P-ring formation chaperone FlgA [Tepidisphaeraceae bacterium]|jgi:flagella basal body P-ring formation protein FlgA
MKSPVTYPRLFQTSAFTIQTFLLLLLSAAIARANTDQFMLPAFRIGTLELQSEATVYSSTITLKQICRWSHDDDAVFQPVADLVLSRFADQSFASVKADDILNMLQGAGVSPAAVRFTGSAACTVTRIDQPIDRTAALVQWTQATEQSKSATQPSADNGLATSVASSSHHADSPISTLEDALTADLANRLQMPVDSLQIKFDPRDDKLLGMTNPPFTFEIAPSRLHNLGNVSWDITLRAGRSSQSAHIAAVARGWQNQVVTANSVQFNQIIRDTDLTEQRVLVDHLDDDQLLTKSQIVNQQAAMDMKIGTLITARKVAAVPMIRTGQLVTVNVRQGGICLQTQARALESATYGQQVHLRNETTKDLFQATVTGPEQADVR